MDKIGTWVIGCENFSVKYILKKRMFDKRPEPFFLHKTPFVLVRFIVEVQLAKKGTTLS